MKLRPGFILRQLGGENVVVPVGPAGETFNGMIRLNDTGALLWQELAVGAEAEALVRKLLDSCEGVDEATARADVDAFLFSIKDALDG